ncbi:MAG: hypothetical protein ABIA77_04970, partial [Candidatus Omnitrophota bacterium]
METEIAPHLTAVPQKKETPSFDVGTVSIPAGLGVVEDFHNADPNRTVIHIQDAHCNYNAQHKIAELIGYLSKEYGINSINLEGGKGQYDLSVFQGIPDRKVREKVADQFVREGLVNGAEYFAVCGPGRIKLWGVENARLYFKNLDVYRNSLEYKEEADKYLETLNRRLNGLKRHIFSDELIKFDRIYEGYKSGEIDIKDYLRYLTEKADSEGINVKAFPNMYLLCLSLEAEEKIDFKRADVERDLLIGCLHEILAEVELKELVTETVKFSRKLISPERFYAYLIKKAGSINLDMGTVPEFRKYIAYVSTYGAVDKSALMREIDALETGIKGTLYGNEKQKELDILSKNLTLTRSLFNVTLTKYDYEYYKKHRASFAVSKYVSFIAREAPVYRITPDVDEDIDKLDRYRDEMSGFYEISFKRDQAFLKNIRFPKVNSRATILVTGGFHTENLLRLFREEGISYVSIIPEFENEKGYRSPYFELLGTGRSPLLEAVSAGMSGIAIQSMLSEMKVPGGDKELFRRAKEVLEALEKGWEITLDTANGSVTFSRGK